MSTLQISQQAIVIPKNLQTAGAAPKRPLRPQRTEISQIYERSSTENLINRKNTSSKLEPIDNELLSLDLLNQYNDIVGPKESLAFKRLPPVKVSYQTTKHKFIESPRVEGSSRIICPHLSMKTYSPGHHIFTEGISKSSITRSPTFSLQQVGVPYSNLPDNISIYKEKDKFAFGVKSDEYEKSPYRLTPKPFKLGSATFIPALEADIEKTNSTSSTYRKTKRGSRSYPERQSLEIKSNVIKLQPLVTKDEKDSKYDFKNKSEFSTDIVKVPGGFTRPAKSPLAPSNSFYLTGTETEAKVNTNDAEVEERHEEKISAKIDTPKRKLSVVSIGETVGPSFYDSKKREARQLYPMYDHTSKKNENLRRQKFEYNEDFIFKAKPKVPSSTFTYKVSTQGMAFLQDNPADRFKPIKNNLYDKHGNVIHKQRGLGRYRPADCDEDVAKSSSDYNFRRYYKRAFRRPKSSESQGTDFSQLPGNPPPSEISHIFSEDAPLFVNDVRNGMVTLIEERTMTAASVISPRKDNTPVGEVRDDNRNTNEISEKAESKLTNIEDTETCTDTDIQFENAIRSIERQQEQEIETARTEIGKNSEFESALGHIEMIRESERDIPANDNSSKGDSSVAEQYIAEAEERIKHISKAEENEKQTVHTSSIDFISESNKTIRLDTIDENQTDKKKVQPKIKAGGNKQFLAVPKLCLDSIDPCPSLQLTKERTSLSRSIQNMTLPEEKQRNNVTNIATNMDFTSEINTGKENKTSLPVTRLRLFSDSSTLSVETPLVNLMDENGDLYEVYENGHSEPKVTDESTKEKKVLNNANVAFIYPSTSEVRAKRQ
ncbi:uncharacterized protein LOC123551475 [Mercenaria mercenaria]|uniref:uncharacterized protein LOC123551475 n=1 Tax=Mercenaria mercenaria TaxID=6596 RepID=UPI00234ECFE8|nr:uncharacterized protein LOC123551475 [Mercenaria mercenaria]XP_045196380.2 uncharacterized protein LOC123551475 [Mercenaria mercenaria]